ncbi:MAG: protein-L-isoaspartate(D-aspartate) O-methyltransferase [Candidatus Brockarchaeota archaeon]|nr:protein-L-isoaspartate(D-aspartate) O-methyltransferase [Candidatus Brockarchaeota archaeon]
MKKDTKKVLMDLYFEGTIKREIVLNAMLNVPREEFVPEEYKAYAYEDIPIPIGEGQTVSALHMVALMCELVELKPGMKVLEIGTGSGYMASVYSEIVGRSGHVYTLEILPSLAKKAMKNILKVNHGLNIDIIVADGSIELPLRIEFDAIIVTASAPDLPENLVKKLKKNGKMVVPVGSLSFYQNLILVEKDEKEKVRTHNFGSVMFVPLKGLKGSSKT